MNKLHRIHISITAFSNGTRYVHRYECHGDDKSTLTRWHDTDMTPYYHEMWELVKRGGKRKVEVNPYAPKCYTVEAEWWEFS